MIAQQPPTEPAQRVNPVLELHTPYGRPLRWADVGMVTDIGDSHELNDDRCLVITSTDLAERDAGPLGDFMLCVLADGATGSTFGPRGSGSDAGSPSTQAGWRASQLAQAVFVERFLSSPEIDILDRLKDGLRAADRELVDSPEGNLSTTLTALFLAADGTACAASIGDSVLLALPPHRKTAAERRLKKLGYEETTSVGSGDTTLSFVDENDLIEQWWPNKEGGRTGTRVEPGTYLVLMSDGIADNLPVEFIDQLLHRHPVDSATVGLPVHTRASRAQTQRRGGGSTSHLGLDNMSAIVIRYLGRRRREAPLGLPRLEQARLVTVAGTHGGPNPALSGQFGLICLAGEEDGATAVGGFLRQLIESESEVGESTSERLKEAFLRTAPSGNQAHFAALAVDELGEQHTFSSGWVDITLLPVRITQRTSEPARDSVLQRFVYTPRVWASSLAVLALLLLVSTAFATGTVRPTPPRAATLVPGQSTPTPDTRPVLSFGGFQLVPPVVAFATPTPTPHPLPPTVDAAPAESNEDSGALPPVDETLPPPDIAAQASFPAAPAAPRSGASRSVRAAQMPQPVHSADPQTVPVSVEPETEPPLVDTANPVQPPASNPLPIASPAAMGGLAEAGPRPGSTLDAALKIAGMASDQFTRSLEEPATDGQSAGR